jgi:uncharacterized membrane protein YkoI
MRSFIVVLLSLFVFAASNDAVAQKKPKMKVPPAIESAFKKAYPNAVIKGVDKEKTNGKTYYEVESVDGKTRRDFLYNEDGTVYETEEAIATSTLPEAVSKSVAKEYPKGKITLAEKVTRGDVTEYEVTVKSGKKKHEVRYDANGAEIKGKPEAEEEGEENEKEEK